MQNLRTFEIKYLGPTNSQGSRVRIKDLRFGTSKTIQYDYEFNNSSDVANEYLKSKSINCEFASEGKDCMYLHTTNFENQIK
jgi:hypothetical protein